MISPDIVILTKAELKAREDAAYQRGVQRGRFDALESAARDSDGKARGEA